MSKLSKAARRARKAQHQKPFAPRVIGANDNHLPGANDDAPVVIRGVTLNRRQARDLMEAEAKLSSADLAVRIAGRDQMAALQDEIDAELAKRLRAESEAETQAVAEARGDRIKKPKADSVMSVSRDGLDTLLSAGTLTRTLHSAALKYREDYERLDPEKGLAPLSLDAARGTVHGGDGWAEKRREIQNRIRSVHLMIAGVDRGPDEKAAMPALPAGHPVMQAIYALEQIAGKGVNLRHLTESGSVRARLSQSLIRALGCCAIVYGLE